MSSKRSFFFDNDADDRAFQEQRAFRGKRQKTTSNLIPTNSSFNSPFRYGRSFEQLMTDSQNVNYNNAWDGKNDQNIDRLNETLEVVDFEKAAVEPYLSQPTVSHYCEMIGPHINVERQIYSRLSEEQKEIMSTRVNKWTLDIIDRLSRNEMDVPYYVSHMVGYLKRLFRRKQHVFPLKKLGLSFDSYLTALLQVHL